MIGVFRVAVIGMAMLVGLSGCVSRPFDHQPYDGPLVREDGTPVEAPAW